MFQFFPNGMDANKNVSFIKMTTFLTFFPVLNIKKIIWLNFPFESKSKRNAHFFLCLIRVCRHFLMIDRIFRCNYDFKMVGNLCVVFFSTLEPKKIAWIVLIVLHSTRCRLFSEFTAMIFSAPLNLIVPNKEHHFVFHFVKNLFLLYEWSAFYFFCVCLL